MIPLPYLLELITSRSQFKGAPAKRVATLDAPRDLEC